MQGYNFTERIRRVLEQARAEAHDLGHEYIGCEHMLLGLASDDGVASVVLQNLGAELPDIAAAVKQIVKRGQAIASPATRELPYTSRAKKSLEYAMAEARELNHSYVGTEHLLIGLLREEKNIAAQVLLGFDITAAKARAETWRILGGGPEDAPKSPPSGESPTRVNVLLHYSNGATVARQFGDRDEAIRFLQQ